MTIPGESRRDGRLHPSPGVATPLVVHALYGQTMGTRWRVSAVAPRNASLHALHAGIQATLDDVVAQMSTWESDADISRYNHATPGTWFALRPHFADVMRGALDVAAASDGAYDPTIGPLVALWGFGAQARSRSVPTDEAIAAARSGVGWQRLTLRDDDDGCALLQPGGVSLDLSAIAKGHGVDAVNGQLAAHGIRAALVDVGGELRALGRKPDGASWRVMVESDDDAHAPPCVLVLDDVAVATSGDCFHHFEQDGRRYAHTLDPRSGRPVGDAAASVTVVAECAMRADAWSTALTVMGADAGFEFAQRVGLAARFVLHGADGPTHRSTAAFEQYVAA